VFDVTTAIYDGYCVLCQQTRKIVQALDWLKRVEFLDIHNWNDVSSRYPSLDFETAMGQMHVVEPDGNMYGGFEGVRRLLRELPLTFPIWLLLQIPGMKWVGDKVYGFIARNRYRINKALGASVCENGACKVHG
jgi:predicted DCC family thiol-disulfide oxidoreductase YuxK